MGSKYPTINLFSFEKNFTGVSLLFSVLNITVAVLADTSVRSNLELPGFTVRDVYFQG